MNSPRRRVSRRLLIVQAAMAAIALALVVQLVRVQFGPYAPVFAQQEAIFEGRRERVIPERGLIFDRNGFLLAANGSRYFVEVELLQLSEASKVEIPIVLTRLCDVPAEDIAAQLQYDWMSMDQYRIRLTRQEGDSRLPIQVDAYAADVLTGFMEDPQAPDVSGLVLVRSPERVYPGGTLAGHVLGFVNQENKGFFGVEGYYEDWLAGRSITIERARIPPEARLQPDAPAGINLVLTIDAEIQQLVEAVLDQAVQQSKSQGGQILVLDPRNGELLALAAWPPLDPTAYGSWLEERPGEQPIITPAVAGLYEPGSTFKVLTMAAALDAGVVTPDEEYVDTGEIEVGGHKIRNWDGNAWGLQTMVGCLQHSLNVCLAHVAADELGASLFYDYMQEFGMGKLTGVDLAGEVSGLLRTPRHPEWTEADLGANSFGQGVSTSPMQLLAAVGALANNGVMMQPRIVREVVGPQGVYWPQPSVLGQPVTTATAETLTDMLIQSLPGETEYVYLPGYALAGKTGTAQIPTEFGYDPRWTIASFVGWGPARDPRFVVLVRLDRPRTSPWGSVVAAPVFQNVVKRLVVLMEIPPDSVREGIAGGG